MCSVNFVMMNNVSDPYVKTQHTFDSFHLGRIVYYDIFQPAQLHDGTPNVILINDGQDLEKMHFIELLNQVYTEISTPIICIGLHASSDRKNEYGTAGVLDYLGRGTTAANYQRCVILELLPLFRRTLALTEAFKFGILGFSLGGLSALDMAWHHATDFNIVGVFSGAFWWRDKDQHDHDFDEHQHRIMQRLVRNGYIQSHLRFFFEAGTNDETADRNNNGIIDAIDDTADLIKELIAKGYPLSSIHYEEILDGKHDFNTWGKVIPVFLAWAIRK